jgi:hypothetical protein
MVMGEVGSRASSIVPAIILPMRATSGGATGSGSVYSGIRSGTTRSDFREGVPL